MTEILQVREEADGTVAVITFNRPAEMNALSVDLLTRLEEILERLLSDRGVGAIVLTGAGKAFCAGGDVNDMATSETRSFEQLHAALMRVHRIPLLLRGASKVVIAAVNGYAMGAGLSLAAACDLRIAARSARFSTAFVKVGLSGDFGGSQSIMQLVGAGRCRDLFLTGRTVDAEEALTMGLVNSVVDDHRLLDAAVDLARKFASGPRLAYDCIKRNLLAAETETFGRVLELEAETQSRMLTTDDHREAAIAFAEKQSPRFSGH